MALSVAVAAMCHGRLCMWEVCSNIVIGLSILDMWSVLCVPYVDGGI